MEATIEKIKLPKTETIIYLEDFGEGKGKIIVEGYNITRSHYWGSMGTDLKSFLKEINSGYFCNKVCYDRYTFSGKATAKEIRRYIREDLNYELPWYEYMSAQKELRRYIKDVEYMRSAEEFIRHMEWLDPYSMSIDLEGYKEREFVDLVRDCLQSEPWNFIQEDYSNEYKYLTKVHKELKKNLCKQLK